jgi:transposase InsO family protein
LEPHQHWHTDISYLNICGTFYSLCSVLDGCSRATLHWEIRASMTEPEVERVLQKAKEQYPTATPRLISDNGPQFIARDFKQFVRLSGMDHVRTSPYYPQSNGKIERWHGSLKAEAVRPKTPLSLEDARRVVGNFVDEYNTTRLHSAIGYVTPHDRLEGRHTQIWEERDRTLEAARARRAARREQAHQHTTPGVHSGPNWDSSSR